MTLVKPKSKQKSEVLRLAIWTISAFVLTMAIVISIMNYNITYSSIKETLMYDIDTLVHENKKLLKELDKF